MRDIVVPMQYDCGILVCYALIVVEEMQDSEPSSLIIAIKSKEIFKKT